MTSIRNQAKTITHEPSSKLDNHIASIDEKKKRNFSRLPLTQNMPNRLHNDVTKKPVIMGIQISNTKVEQEAREEQAPEGELGEIEKLQNEGANEGEEKLAVRVIESGESMIGVVVGGVAGLREKHAEDDGVEERPGEVPKCEGVVLGREDEEGEESRGEEEKSGEKESEEAKAFVAEVLEVCGAEGELVTREEAGEERKEKGPEFEAVRGEREALDSVPAEGEHEQAEGEEEEGAGVGPVWASGMGRDGAGQFGEDHGGGAAVAEGLEAEEEEEGEEGGFGG